MRAPDDERLARVALMALAEPNDARLWRLVVRVGPVAALARVTDDDAPFDETARGDHPGGEGGARGAPGDGACADGTHRGSRGDAEPHDAQAHDFAHDAGRPRRDYRVRLPLPDPGDLLDAATAAGVRLVVPGDLEWPSQLEQLDLPAGGGQRASCPPLGLWVHGAADLRRTVLRSAAVVGSRAATAYGTRVAGELAGGLADRGWAVVSGAAFGIDAAAHRGSLAAGGRTVAVLACGADVAYPRAHQGLLSRVADEGLVVSELPLGAVPTRARFLDRNRLIAALSPATVVVEAAFRSGALNTVGWARRLGRPVLAVPGPVTSPLSAGPHRELREGRATLVTDAGQIVEEAGSMGEALAEAAAAHVAEGLSRAAAVRPGDALPSSERLVLDALDASSWLSEAAVGRRAAIGAGAVEAALRSLAEGGLVERRGDRWRAVHGDPPR